MDHEFRTEVRLSLDRAFSEGHSLENASVELKTLRMASNVPLRRVREAVVAGIVERIPLVEGAVPQRAEIKKWVDRWGELINLIGGIDGVEYGLDLTGETSPFLPDVCDLAPITIYFAVPTARARRAFTSIRSNTRRHFIKTMSARGRGHSEIGTLQPEAKGEDVKDRKLLENLQKTWIVGARMIHQFNEQESDDDEGESGSSEGEDDDAD